MNPFKDAKKQPEENLNESEVLEATEVREDELEETGEFSNKVSEVAKDNISEQKSGSAGQKSQAQDQKTAKQPDLSDRLALRERLLATAPKESVMRSQVREVLLKEKVELEKEVKKHKHNYHLMSEAMAKLRAVMKQLQDLANASYELLQDIWLKVVHRFA